MNLDDLVVIFSPSNPVWRSGFRKFLVLFGATGLFSGFIPIAPGTFGSLVGTAFVWYCFPSSVLVQLLLCVVVFLFGSWLSAVAIHLFNKADPQRVNIDEIVGVMITMIGIPLTFRWLVMGFIIFRVLDVMKPVPANFFDSGWKNGWGVMMDDVVAGIYGCVVMHLMLRAQF